MSQRSPPVDAPVLEVSAAGPGTLVASVHNPADCELALPHAPVVGLRAVARDRRWRSACRFDPTPVPYSLASGQTRSWHIGWAEALRGEGGPAPPGDYEVWVVFRLALDGPVTISEAVRCTQA